MTFACKNHEFDTDTCRKLKTECIMGRKGCVLEGKVNVPEATRKRLRELEEERKDRISSRENGD